MSLPAPEVISHFYEIGTSPQIDPTFTFADGTVAVAERPVVYAHDPAWTDPSSAVWVDHGYTGGGSDGTKAKPYTTIKAGLTAIKGSGTGKALVIRGAHGVEANSTAFDGRYREDFGNAPADHDLNSASGKVRQITCSVGDGPCVVSGCDIITGFTGTGPYTYSSAYNPPVDDLVVVDGVLQRKVTGTPTQGQYAVSGTTLTLGTNPSGKTVEVGMRAAPVKKGDGISTNNIEIRGIGIHQFCSSSQGAGDSDPGSIHLTGTGQKLTRVVIANDTGQAMAISSATNPTLTEVVLSGCGNIGGKSSNYYNDNGRRTHGLRVWANNILHVADVCPGQFASRSGVKIAASKNAVDDQVLVGWCWSHGYWFDVRCASNRITNFVAVHNGGQGLVNEVGAATQLANAFIGLNGALNNTSICGGHPPSNVNGMSVKGYQDVEIYQTTLALNYGSNILIEEDERTYPSNAYPGLGDTYGLIRTNNVHVRLKTTDAAGGTIGVRQNLKSTNVVANPLNCDPNAANGQAQTFTYNHAQMHSVDPTATPLVLAGCDHNVYIDATGNKNFQVAAPNAGSQWVYTPCSPPPCSTCKTACSDSSCTATATVDLTAITSPTGIEAHSIDLKFSAGAKTPANLFPHSADALPEWSWWGLATIPSTATALSAGTVPAWVRTAMGLGSTDTLYPGCGPGLPYPRAIGQAGGNAPPTVTNLIPVDGASIVTGVAQTVSVDASDDGGFAGLSCVGQTYSPAVATTAITVASGVVTVNTGSTAHGATNGGRVRIAGATPSSLNGTFTVTSTADNFHLTYAAPSGATTATVQGTVEPLGTTISMAANAGSTGFAGTWTTGAPAGSTRRLEVTVTDSGTPVQSTTVVATLHIAAAGNHTPVAVVLDPQPSEHVATAAGQTIAAYIFDQDGDALSSPLWSIKDSTPTQVLTGALTAQASAVSTTVATAIADVSTLTGTQNVDLASAAGVSSTGGVLVALHNNVPVTIQYGGVSGNSLTNCQLLAGTGALSIGDLVRSANYAATFDATGLSGAYTITAQASDASSTGISPSIAFTTNSAPTVTWVYPSPTTKQTVSGTIALQITASDDAGLPNLHGGLYKIDAGSSYVGPLVATATGFTYSFDTTSLTDQQDHKLRVRVVDSNGLVTSADVTFHVDQGADTTGPTITGVAPAAGASVSGTIAVGAQITDASGVASAGYSIDGGTLSGPLTAGPFGWVAALDTTDQAHGLADGPHTLVITATDTNNNTASTAAAPVSFTVANTGSASWAPNHNAVGISVPTQPAALATADRTALWALVAASGARVVRTVADWSVLQPTNPGNATAGLNDTLDTAALAALDAFVDDAGARGVTVILTVYRTPTWAHPTTTVLPGSVTWGALSQVAPEREPENGYPDLANFCWLLADRYGTAGGHSPPAGSTTGTVVAIEVWDEPNTEHWMQPDGTGTRGNGNHYGADAGMYAQAVIGAYNAIHDGVVAHRGTRATHPEILVVAGATGVAKGNGGPSAQNYTPGAFYVVFLAVPGAAAAFDHVSHHPQFDGVLYAGHD